MKFRIASIEIEAIEMPELEVDNKKPYLADVGITMLARVNFCIPPDIKVKKPYHLEHMSFKRSLEYENEFVIDQQSHIPEIDKSEEILHFQECFLQLSLLDLLYFF